MNINFENRSDIVRDAHTKAILATDRSAYMAAKKRKEDQDKYTKLENDVREIKKNMLNISNLLQELLSRGNK